MDRLSQLVEAALFSADGPVSINTLCGLERDVTKSEIVDSLETIRRQYADAGHGLELVEVADGYQVLTKREFADAIARAHLVTRPRRLSGPALETLAIIAYRQPVGRAEIEEIRGVSVESVLRSLQDRGLVDVVGRSEGTGRPLLYGTTPGFLELLGLKNLDDLPRLDELSVALRSPEDVHGMG
jgi:segregation and condensation protein B